MYKYFQKLHNIKKEVCRPDLSSTLSTSRQKISQKDTDDVATITTYTEHRNKASFSKEIIVRKAEAESEALQTVVTKRKYTKTVSSEHFNTTTKEKIKEEKAEKHDEENVDGEEFAIHRASLEGPTISEVHIFKGIVFPNNMTSVMYAMLYGSIFTYKPVCFFIEFW